MSNNLIDANSPALIREQLRSILLQEIEDGVHRPGARFPSERALAERFHVSRTSVRETITQLLTEGVLLRAAGRGTFVNAGQKPRSAPEASRQIGCWISASLFNFVQPGYSQILTGAGEVCRNRGFRSQFHPVDETKQPLDLIFADDTSTGGMDGNLVIGGVNRYVLDRLRSIKSPLLLVDLLVSQDSADAVRIEYASGTRQAIAHLQALGHSEIGFIGFPGSQKYEAFWQSLEAYGMNYNPRHVQFLSVSELAPGMLAGYRSMQAMIEGGRLPTAILVTNDCVALGVLDALKIAGVRVPEDISVVGCDDLGSSAQQLTTIQVDLTEVGRVAANALLDRIESGVEPQGPILVPVRFVVRDTSGPPKARPGTASLADGACLAR